jgi:hypothetical protein
MIKSAVDYRVWLYQNLVLVILCTIVGGRLIVGGAEYLLFDWTKVLRTVQDKQTDLIRSPGQKSAAPAPPKPAPSAPSAPPMNPSRGGADSLDLERVRQVFAAFDADRDGAVGAQELMCALGALGFRYPLTLVQSMLAAGRDRDPDGAAGHDGAAPQAVGAEAFEGLVRRLCDMESLGLRGAAA